MFIKIFITIIILTLLIFAIFKDRKTKRIYKFPQPSNKQKKQIAIEKEKSRSGFPGA